MVLRLGKRHRDRRAERGGDGTRRGRILTTMVNRVDREQIYFSQRTRVGQISAAQGSLDRNVGRIAMVMRFWWCRYGIFSGGSVGRSEASDNDRHQQDSAPLPATMCPVRSRRFESLDHFKVALPQQGSSASKDARAESRAKQAKPLWNCAAFPSLGPTCRQSCQRLVDILCVTQTTEHHPATNGPLTARQKGGVI